MVYNTTCILYKYYVSIEQSNIHIVSYQNLKFHIFKYKLLIISIR